MTKVEGGKKPPALSKLSRPKKADNSKKKTATKECDPFNESDDFVESSNMNKRKVSSKQTAEKNCHENVSPTESSTVLACTASSDILPKCRFCGKLFQIGQELKW